jgi:alpha-D-xyloside xylohydrolase
LHGSSSYRVPWLFDEAGFTGPTASDVLRFFTKLKCRLMPYLFNAAVEAHEHGIPMMRAMPLAFPDDPGCDTLDRQYMLGESLLVAPVFSADGKVDYYLPPGRWSNILSDVVVEGGRWVRETHGYLSLPLLASSNSIIPVGVVEQKPDYEFADGVTFHLFELDDGATASASVPTLKGKMALTLEAHRKGAEIHIQAQGTSSGWSVLLRGIKMVNKVKHGVAQVETQGTRIVPAVGKKTMIIEL